MIDIKYDLFKCIWRSWKWYIYYMGPVVSKQQMEKLKSDKINIYELQAFLKHVKTEEDIEEAIKHYLSIMTVKEKIGQLQQLSYGA